MYLLSLFGTENPLDHSEQRRIAFAIAFISIFVLGADRPRGEPSDVDRDQRRCVALFWGIATTGWLPSPSGAATPAVLLAFACATAQAILVIRLCNSSSDFGDSLVQRSVTLAARPSSRISRQRANIRFLFFELKSCPSKFRPNTHAQIADLGMISGIEPPNIVSPVEIRPSKDCGGSN
jgi:hypothetical protein